jgi:hypothetical protein
MPIGVKIPKFLIKTRSDSKSRGNAGVGLPGMAGYGSQHKDQGRPQALHVKPLFDRAAQMRAHQPRELERKVSNL